VLPIGHDATAWEHHERPRLKRRVGSATVPQCVR